MEKRSKTNAQLSIAALFKASFLVLVVLLLPFPFFSCSEVPIPPGQTTPEGSRAARAVPVYTYRVVNAYPHDKTAFTQGLVYDGGALYEGTGLYRRSTLRKVELETGNILQVRDLPAQFFGEGIIVWQNRIVQLTWQSRVGFIYDKSSFELLGQFTYSTEGWGITHDGNNLILSDGTSRLYFLDPNNFEEVRRLEVFGADGPAAGLNELEYIRGEIYANVWPTNRIARISPMTGRVVGWIELDGLLEPADRQDPVDVLNGIAYDAENDRLFVTGKLWPKLFEIKLVSLS